MQSPRHLKSSADPSCAGACSKAKAQSCLKLDHAPGEAVGGTPEAAGVDDIRGRGRRDQRRQIQNIEPWRVCQAFLPPLRKCPAGRIVNVSSESGSLANMGADPGASFRDGVS